MAIEQTYNGPDWGKIPDGWREVSQKEFAEQALVRIYAPMRYEYRQFPFDGYHFGATLWWMHDGTGHCMYLDASKGIVRFFLFGCEHAYFETSRPAGNRSGLHSSKCAKCGYVRTVDTSD